MKRLSIIPMFASLALFGCGDNNQNGDAAKPADHAMIIDMTMMNAGDMAVTPDDLTVLPDMTLTGDLAGADLTVVDLATLPDLVPSDMATAAMGTEVMVGPACQTVFSPQTLTVKLGATVTWTWACAGHTVTSGTNGMPDGVFCSPFNMNCANSMPLAAGSKFTYTFNKVGTFPYFCIPHVNAGMTGSIIVK